MNVKEASLCSPHVSQARTLGLAECNPAPSALAAPGTPAAAHGLVLVQAHLRAFISLLDEPSNVATKYLQMAEINKSLAAHLASTAAVR